MDKTIRVMEREIKNTVSHMIDAKSCLAEAALSLQKVKPHNFEPTIKEIKETIGDLCCTIYVLQVFVGENIEDNNS